MKIRITLIACTLAAGVCFAQQPVTHDGKPLKEKSADSPKQPLTDGQKLAIRTAQLNLSANGEKMKDKQREAADLQRQIAELQGKLAALESPWNALNKERMDLLDKLAAAFKAAGVKPEELDADLNLTKPVIADKK